jgi:hypothetical protein
MVKQYPPLADTLTRLAKKKGLWEWVFAVLLCEYVCWWLMIGVPKDGEPGNPCPVVIVECLNKKKICGRCSTNTVHVQAQVSDMLIPHQTALVGFSQWRCNMP